ncbi:MmpS family transport accessory protein [Mycobacterium sp. 155]|uniref:MmpS family transport accessory protein n=1 Tax=Mycobacterium sp. 155 TaxID=1157943 RepID=UPI00037B7B48|nr:MmpS family transport accessory protein [Mycobacterium sp. 155]
MTRHYSPYGTTSTERFGEHSTRPGSSDPDDNFRSRYRSSDDSEYRTGGDDAGFADYDAYVGDSPDEDIDDEIYEYYDPADRRWMWVAAVAGVILLVAVICTVIILGGGDSGSVSATVTSSAAPTTSQPTTTPAQDATSKPVPTPAPPVAGMSPETVTTVTPTPQATAEPTPEPAPPAEAAPPATVASPRTITYTVTGTRQLIDLVSIVYTDQQGALQTDINVALPWTKTVTLDPGVELKSVTATSVAGQLDCAITDANGTVLVQQANNTMIATCTQ